MMPIFFHLQSHLWIAYLFFFNGLLIHWLLRSFSSGYFSLTEPMEAQVLAAFFISIALNGTLMFSLDWMGLKFSTLSVLLPLVSGCLVLLSIWRSSASKIGGIFLAEIDYVRLALYAFVFLILFYNGGLIERITDAWWHMALANKIGLASSLRLEAGPLTGLDVTYYPSLWHGNLALANTLSGVSLPVIWNSFTAWGGVLKVMGFYLFAYSLSGNKATAIISAALFVLLPGIGDSYLRVSAWPSHIAYTAWFGMFYILFRLFDTPTHANVADVRGAVKALRVFIPGAMTFSVLALIVLFSHKAELLWFAIGIGCYGVALTLSQVFGEKPKQFQETHNVLFDFMCSVIFLVALIASARLCYQQSENLIALTDTSIAYLLPVVLFALLLFLRLSLSIRFLAVSPKVAKSLVFVIVALVFASVDARQLMSLFKPELAYALNDLPEKALTATGFLGGALYVPGWHLQLRYGLLYAGVISIPLSIMLAMLMPGRLTLFTAGTGTVAFLFCCSPYLYQWLTDVLFYHSAWRVALLIFHPIVIAATMVFLWTEVRWTGSKAEGRSATRNLCLTTLLLAAVALLVFDSRYHFDDDLITLKRQHQSDQQNWSTFYPQENVYYGSSFRYQNDFARIAEILVPDKTLYSDLGTSYYAAASLPVNVVNVHHHQGRGAQYHWRQFLDARYACYLEFEENREKLRNFIADQKKSIDPESRHSFDYVLLNKDTDNAVLRTDCFSHRQHILQIELPKLLNPLYTGEFLNLYQVM